MYVYVVVVVKVVVVAVVFVSAGGAMGDTVTTFNLLTTYNVPWHCMYVVHDACLCVYVAVHVHTCEIVCNLHCVVVVFRWR